jgi:PIN domain nuclease of toxin-antitoxin system
MTYVLDTHTWIWWHMNPGKLSTRAKSAIGDPGRYEEILLSVISAWEFCKLLEKERMAISCDVEQWMDLALDMPKLRLVPLTPLLAYRSTVLPPPFHDDPADQIIVATARQENAVLLTADHRLRKYRHVTSLW